jgi:hypothetical protein
MSDEFMATGLEMMRKAGFPVAGIHTAKAVEPLTESDRLDSHRGEGPCMDCGTLDTPVWSAPNDLWNRVVGSPDGYLCPWCFTVRADDVLGWQVWDLRPRNYEPDPRIRAMRRLAERHGREFQDFLKDEIHGDRDE